MKVVERYKQAKVLIKENKLDEANKVLEDLIFRVANYKRKGQEQVDGISIERWRTRIWTTIEKAGLL